MWVNNAHAGMRKAGLSCTIHASLDGTPKPKPGLEYLPYGISYLKTISNTARTTPDKIRTYENILHTSSSAAMFDYAIVMEVLSDGVVYNQTYRMLEHAFEESRGDKHAYILAVRKEFPT